MPLKDNNKHKEYLRQHYQEHKAEYLARNKEAKLRKAAYIREQKEKPCADCGVQYPYYVMEYDHLGDKLFNISLMPAQSWKQIYAEIAKCDVVCANCHKARTYKRYVSVAE